MPLTSITKTFPVAGSETINPGPVILSEPVELMGFGAVRFIITVTENKDHADPMLAIYVADRIDGTEAQWTPIEASAIQLDYGCTGVVILDCSPCRHRYAAVGIGLYGGSGEPQAKISGIIAELYDSRCLPVQQSDMVAGCVVSDG